MTRNKITIITIVILFVKQSAEEIIIDIKVELPYILIVRKAISYQIFELSFPSGS